MGSRDHGCWPIWFVREAIARYGLSAVDVVVFVVVCDHANGERQAWPSQRLIAEEGNLGRTAVKASLQHLVEQGLLIVLEQGGGRGRPTRYEIPRRMPRPGQVRFLPTPTRRAVHTGDSWAVAP